MTPHLYACYFAPPQDIDREWVRLARVLRMTAAQHCPSWQQEILAITPTPMKSRIGKRTHVANSQKLEYWCDRVAAAANGDRLLLIDADTAIVRPIDDVWDYDFDVAYTVRSGSKFPLNGGVLFLRISDRVKAFIKDWRRENTRMLGDNGFETKQQFHRYGGINQAAFGALIAQGDPHGLRILALPCAEWNCEDSAWASFDPDVTRILHVKSDLRKAVFGKIPMGEFAPLVRRWKDLEHEAAYGRPRMATCSA